MAHDVRDFQTEVIERSKSIPVLVDFWAEWCGPCRILGPVLERLAAQAGGAWELAKVDTEEHFDVARQFGISGIPAVKLFIDGKVSAEFVGALPEYQVQQWLKKFIPRKSKHEIDRAKELIALGKVEEARPVLEEIVGIEPDNEQARTLLARTLVFSDPERVNRLTLDVVDPAVAELAEALRTLAYLFGLASHPESLPDHSVKAAYLSAINCMQKSEFDEALEQFINIIREDRKFDTDGARKACIAIFKFLGEEHPTTLKHRRDFGNALY